MGQSILVYVIKTDHTIVGGKEVLVVTQCVEDGIKAYYTYALWDEYKTSKAMRANNLDEANANHERLIEDCSAKDILE